MRPHITVNFACSLDGRIASKGGRAFKFSNYEDLVRVHKMRSETDMIIVGKNTINLDDPKLVVNPKYYKSNHLPDVGILDTNLTVNPKAKVFGYPRNVVVFCGRDIKVNSDSNDLESKIMVRNSNDGYVDSYFVVKELEKLGYTTVMIEGGRSVITSFVSEGNWDEISIFYSPVIMGDDGIPMFGALSDPLKLGSLETSKLGDGVLIKIKKEF
ncbi:MAG: RibD family protein [Thermoplasmatales archaeon]|jgi:riboflavin-specific deaminase-like protein|nr:RibD family protein [Candidatus Thermoplasmatota archaeon]MDA8055014.1 RibD family protein [Thermoplasmatales archaeon]